MYKIIRRIICTPFLVLLSPFIIFFIFLISEEWTEFKEDVRTLLWEDIMGKKD